MAAMARPTAAWLGTGPLTFAETADGARRRSGRGASVCEPAVARRGGPRVRAQLGQVSEG